MTCTWYTDEVVKADQVLGPTPSHSTTHRGLYRWLFLCCGLVSSPVTLSLPVCSGLREWDSAPLQTADPVLYLGGLFKSSERWSSFWSYFKWASFPSVFYTDLGRTEKKKLFCFVLSILGFQPDEEMSEIITTEFQMRLLWGSKGAQVNQAERYEKFNQILTALSRKLEPPPVKQAELWWLSRERSDTASGFSSFFFGKAYHLKK